MPDYKPVMVDGVPRCSAQCSLCGDDNNAKECWFTRCVVEPVYLTTGINYRAQCSLCEPAILARLKAAEACCEIAATSMSFSLITLAVEAWRKAKGVER